MPPHEKDTYHELSMQQAHSQLNNKEASTETYITKYDFWEILKFIDEWKITQSILWTVPGLKVCDFLKSSLFKVRQKHPPIGVSQNICLVYFPCFNRLYRTDILPNTSRHFWITLTAKPNTFWKDNSCLVVVYFTTRTHEQKHPVRRVLCVR